MRLKILTLGAALLLGTSAVACNPAQIETVPTSVEGLSEVTGVYSAGWITVRTYGSGPDVILIPGLASSASVWNETIKRFENSYRIHVVQMAGFADAPASAVERKKIVDGLAADIASYIDTKALDNPIVAGHSMGGFTALHLARDFPEKVSQIVVVDSLPFFPVIFNPEATVEGSTPQAVQMISQMNAMPQLAYNMVQKQNAKIYAKSKTTQKRIGEWAVNSDREVVLHSIFELMTTDLRPDLSTITMPVAIIYAHDDAMGMPAAAMAQLYESQYAALPNGSLSRIDESFHFIMDDQPEAFYNTLGTILTTTGGT